jgi:menaquinol-cytochrome c reductase iron-sulfur subunit
METRRSFAEWALKGLTGVIGAVLGGLGGAYLLTPARQKDATVWAEAAGLEELKDGVPEEVLFERRRRDGWRLLRERTSAWVVKKSPQEVVAFAPSCTHLGCAFKWDSSANNFICPCHTSAFSVDGKVLAGPAPRPLDRYEVRLSNGKVLLGGIRRA